MPETNTTSRQELTEGDDNGEGGTDNDGDDNDHDGDDDDDHDNDDEGKMVRRCNDDAADGDGFKQQALEQAGNLHY